jgi:hypothetical protein
MGAPVFCGGDDCGVRTFAEYVAGLTARYARCTVLLRGMLESIGVRVRPSGPRGRRPDRRASGCGSPAR